MVTNLCALYDQRADQSTDVWIDVVFECVWGQGQRCSTQTEMIITYLFIGPALVEFFNFRLNKFELSWFACVRVDLIGASLSLLTSISSFLNSGPFPTSCLFECQLK